MTYTQTAIDKAKTGGYEITNDWGTGRVVKPLNDMLIDPAFWKALEVSGVWNGKFSKGVKYPWRVEMHCFVDHICEYGDVESFFKQLLTPKS